jgi:hypothetical protein
MFRHMPLTLVLAAAAILPHFVRILRFANRCFVVL